MLTRQSLAQELTQVSTAGWQGTDDFVGFERIFLTINHQMDAVEWSAFDQKIHLVICPGIPFSILTRQSLAQELTQVSTAGWQGTDDFVGFERIFLTINHQMDAVEWPAFDQKIHLLKCLGIPFSILTRRSLAQELTQVSTAGWQGTDDFVGFERIFLTINHQIDAVEWPAFDQKIHLVICPSIPFSILTRRSLAQELTQVSTAGWQGTDDFVGFDTIFLNMNHQIKAR
jgi:hypothetical protein